MLAYERKETFRFAVKAMGSTVMKSLERAGLQKEDIDYLIPHQANIRIIESAAKRLHLPMDKVFVNIENMVMHQRHLFQLQWLKLINLEN